MLVKCPVSNNDTSFQFAGEVPNKPSIDPRFQYVEQFGLSLDEIDRLELIVNTLASDFAETPRFSIVENEAGMYNVEVVPSSYVVASDIHCLVKKYVYAEATINPDRNLVKLVVAKKVYAQFMVKFLQDYNVRIKEFSYPIDNFV